MKLTNNSDVTISQPDEHDIARAILQMFEDRDNDFVVLAKSETDDDYIQTVPMSQTAEMLCRVEFRDSVARRHFAVENLSLNQTVALFHQWNQGDERFRRAVAWRDISAEFEWNN